MFIIGIITTLVLLGILKLRQRRTSFDAGPARRVGAGLAAFTLATAALLTFGSTASAAIVPTVELGTSADFAVLAGQTVTNIGDTVLDGSLGVWPGTAITGFPPGVVLPPGTTHAGDAVAGQAQADLTAAYVDAAGRPIDVTTEDADLAGLTLQGGVYEGPAHSALELNGTLTLDGAGDPNTVFIFQTDSTLITGSSSTVNLINGAQACNVFWQVGSSATLGTNSVFVGNILALTKIAVNTNVTVEGRALARNAEVTLDDDTFTDATCDEPTTEPTTTTTTSTTTTTTTTAPTTTTTNGGTPTTAGGVTEPVPTVPVEGPEAAGSPGDTDEAAVGTGTGSGGSPDQPGPNAPPTDGDGDAPPTDGDTDGPLTGTPDLTENRLTDEPNTTTNRTDLPRTGSTIMFSLVLSGAALALGALALGVGRRKHVAKR